MISTRKIRSVATFEFLCTVKRKGYLIATFGMPVFVAMYGAIVSVPVYFAAKHDSARQVYGIVDEAGVLALTGEERSRPVDVPAGLRSAIEATGQGDTVRRAIAAIGGPVFRPYPDEAAAREALTQGSIEGYYRFGGNFVEDGRVAGFFPEGVGLDRKDSRRPLRELIQRRLLAGRVSEPLARRVGEPIAELHEWTVSPSGEVSPSAPWAVFAKIIIPLLFAVLMLISLMMSSGYLIQATAVEKENKVVEVLLSSANPDEILAGKLLGLGAAGVLQVCIWFGMVGLGGVLLTATLSSLGVSVPWAAIGASVAFFVAGYLFLGSLMLATGSLGSNTRESQQYSVVWSMLAISPLILLQLFLTAPHGTIPRVMTWIPFTAPLTVVLRLALDPAGTAWWEVLGSLTVLVVSIGVAIRFGARLFRVGLLLTGTRPKLREILKQARLSS